MERGLNAGRRPIAMVVHAYYDEDPRVRREAEALVAAGHQVDVFALRREHDAVTGTLAGVSVRRLGVGVPVTMPSANGRNEIARRLS